jgi:membrane fusion protein, copper/silver efflux system
VVRAQPWMIAVAGLAAGAVTIALMPADALFRPAPAAAVAAGAGDGARYACPMMDFIARKPGDCPVCGMVMTRVTAGELNAEQMRRMELRTTVVRSGPAVATVRAYGVADYDHRFTRVVIPRVAGRIVRRHEGTSGQVASLAAGAPVVDLYSPEVIAVRGELEAAKRLGDAVLVANLRARFSRWNLDEVADAVLAGGTVDDAVTIRTPFAGEVLLRRFEEVNDALAVGREVMPGDPLVRLVDEDRLVLVIQVPEHRARWIRVGQGVELATDDAGPLPEVDAVVDRVATEIDAALRTREVRIYLTGARERIAPGALVSVRLRVALGTDLAPADPAEPAEWGQFALVPKTAVLSTGVRHVAWKVATTARDGRRRFELAALALGPRLEDAEGNDLYVVRAGLAPGDEVATQAAFLIDSQAQLAGGPSLLYPLGAAAEASSGGHAH